MELDFLPALIGDALGSSHQLEAYEPVVERNDYLVLVVTLGPAQTKVVVKLSGPAAPQWAQAATFERAPVLSRLIRRQGVEVPEVLAVDTSRDRWPHSYLITTFIEGTTLAVAAKRLAASDRAQLFTELGNAVARLHGLTFSAFGELMPSGEVQARSPYPEALMKRAAERVSNGTHLDLFRELVEAHRGELGEVRRAALTHEDLNPYNLLVAWRGETAHLAAVLDLSSAWAGNPESDLARLELWRGMMHPAFWAAYQPEPQIASGYARRRAVLQFLWCLEYASPNRQHHAVTAAVCASLGIPAVRFD